ncbi:MFS transporter [Homoserinibacter sp. YIM 151385]|uniref:MFS transporter n=1 Tax=Homoserinibacter sp. YIM 151385 TaxID=2985506 RepID=UPI0022F121EE|nr:MFS transporter [Homoserinibacter sp. YIM 151385]WBU37308.1 MFS transporter [Homoserinibacter sp. YIM 151385]
MSDTTSAPAAVTRRQVLSWALWDWAAQPYNTVILSFVFAPLYLQSELFLAPGQTEDDLSGQMGLIIGIGGFVIAVLAPVLGQRTDASGRGKLWLGVWTGLLIAATAALVLVEPLPSYFLLGAILVAVANIISEFANVNYYAMLAQVSTPSTIGRVSGLGWGFGYLGGIIMLALVIAVQLAGWFGLPQETGLRLVAVGCALWTLLFCIPLFRDVPSAAPAAGRERVGFLRSYVVLAQDIRRLWRESRSTFWFLLSSAVYRDGLAGVFTFAGSIAAITFGFDFFGVVVFGVVANIVAGVVTILAGRLDDRIGPRRVILGSLTGLVIVGLLVFLLRDLGPAVFWVGGLTLAAFVGPAQTASRSLLARLAPADRQGEIFGLYATTGRATSFFSPVLWGALIAIGGSQAWGILGVLLILLVGLVLTALVKLPEGAG